MFKITISIVDDERIRTIYLNNAYNKKIIYNIKSVVQQVSIYCLDHNLSRIHLIPSTIFVPFNAEQECNTHSLSLILFKFNLSNISSASSTSSLSFLFANIIIGFFFSLFSFSNSCNN